MTHYGQVCCYDETGFLMQTPYQPVIKTQKEYFYNPGYPLRAYEFGTAPYMGQFEVRPTPFQGNPLLGSGTVRLPSRLHALLPLL